MLQVIVFLFQNVNVNINVQSCQAIQRISKRETKRKREKLTLFTKIPPFQELYISHYINVKKESHVINIPQFSSKTHDTEKRRNIRWSPSSRIVRVWPATKQTFEKHESCTVQRPIYSSSVMLFGTCADQRRVLTLFVNLYAIISVVKSGICKFKQ